MRALEDEEFRGFVIARGPALLRTAYLLTGDQQLAEDLVQSALERTAARWSSIRVAAAAESYVRRTMYRQQVSLWRRHRIAETLTDALPEASTPSTDDDLVENRLVLREALFRLGRRQRAVLVLRYYEDRTEQEVAAILGISVGTVKSQSAKALHRLRVLCPDLAAFAPAGGGGEAR